MPLKETPCRIKSPELWAIARLDAAIAGIREGDSLSPIDAVGVHAVITALAQNISCNDAEVGGVSLIPRERRMDVLILSTGGRTSELVDRWIEMVSQLKHAPSNWTLNVYLDDATITARSLELPQWYVSTDDF